MKLALEQLLDGPCHHMMEMFGNEEQIAGWTDAIEGRPVDWSHLLRNYRAIVDWPGGAFWREILAANPDALVLLSVRESGEAWYRSASNTIFLAFDNMPPEVQPWMTSVRKLLRDRYTDEFDNKDAMVAAYEAHNQAVRDEVPASQLLEWTPSDGWARSASASGCRCRRNHSRSRTRPTTSAPCSACPRSNPDTRCRSPDGFHPISSTSSTRQSAFHLDL